VDEKQGSSSDLDHELFIRFMEVNGFSFVHVKLGVKVGDSFCLDVICFEPSDCVVVLSTAKLFAVFSHEHDNPCTILFRSGYCLLDVKNTIYLRRDYGELFFRFVDDSDNLIGDFVVGVDAS
jgi:hypothetical protein